MYVIFPAADVVEESYLALVAQESEAPPTGLATVEQTAPSLPPSAPNPIPQALTHSPPQLVNSTATGGSRPIYHDTRQEQQRAQHYITQVTSDLDPLGKSLTQLQPASDGSFTDNDKFYFQDDQEPLPDLVSASIDSSGRPDSSTRKHPGRFDHTIYMKTMANQPPPNMLSSQGVDVMAPPSNLKFPDLIHPSINETLKTQQQSTFRLVKTSKCDHYHIEGPYYSGQVC